MTARSIAVELVTRNRRTTLALAILIAFFAGAAIAADFPAGTGEESRPGNKAREIHVGASTAGDDMLLTADTGVSQAESDAAQPFSVRVTLEATDPLHAINPLIYGASAVELARAKVLGVAAVRWVGNRSSRYNWKTRADNAGSDWFFLS
jgi:hypothetical protein